MNSLRYVLVYVFATERGAYLIDAGWNTDEAFDALADGLKQAGFAMSDVRGVMVTHIHPDHYGLAGRIREASGAWISLHPADARLIQSRYIDPDELLKMVSSSLSRAGASEDELVGIGAASMPVRGFVEPTLPDVLHRGRRPSRRPGLEPAGHPHPRPLARPPLLLPGRAAADADRRPRAAAHHAQHLLSPAVRAPTRSATSSTRSTRSRGEDVELVLPAHEHRFVGLSARVDALKAHHHQRFSECVAAIRGGDDTAFAIAARMSWSRSWDRIDGFMRRAAVGEALAHLHALRERGILTYDEPAPGSEEPIHWRIVDSAVAEGLTA